MKILEVSINSKLNILNDLTVCIGNFDGIHLGHQNLINETLKFHNNALITFNPHPREILNKDFKLIISHEDKIKKLSQYSFDYLIIFTIDSNFLKLSANLFIEWLKKNNIKRIIVGNDFRFGNKGLGNYELLQNYFETIALELISYQKMKISSSLVKEYIYDGKFEEVNYLLGYNYYVKGIIENGSKVGRKLGFPTANIDYKNLSIPNDGVYICEVELNNHLYNGILSIGNNPTLNTQATTKLEVYILNFSNDIYNEEIKVFFKKKLRNQIKFNNKDELISQINDDLNKTIEFFK